MAKLIRVVFVHPDGSQEMHAARVGETVMDCALDHGVRGIKAQCGGACICVTCHCWLAPEWFARLPPPNEQELEMLEYAWSLTSNSRLACQVELDDASDGVVVHVPERQG